MTHWFLSQQELKTEVKSGLENIVAEDVRVMKGGEGMSSTLRGGGTIHRSKRGGVRERKEEHRREQATGRMGRLSAPS
jgi:hypothetical protein